MTLESWGVLISESSTLTNKGEFINSYSLKCKVTIKLGNFYSGCYIRENCCFQMQEKQNISDRREKGNQENKKTLDIKCSVLNR